MCYLDNLEGSDLEVPLMSFPCKLLEVSLPGFFGGLHSCCQSFVVCLWRFWRKLRSGLIKLRVIPARPDLDDPYRFSRRSPYRCRTASSLCYLFPGIIWSSWIVWIATASNISGSLVFYLWCYPLVTKKVLWDFLPFYPMGLLQCPSFLIFIEERDINIIAIEEILVLFLGFNHFWLTMLPSDFVLKIT